jgi:hypothetical protein
MPAPTNLPTVYSNPSAEVFPNYFDRGVSISDNDYDQLVGLLELRTQNVEAAQNLAATVIQGLVQQDLDVKDIIDRLRRSSNTEIDTLLAFFLNNVRVGTSYLGISAQYITNPYITRTILP